MTPHIESSLEDIASVVIMPGDPNRVKYIADNYLENAKLINQVRGEFGYTGTYKGRRLTVFSSGMGIPSMGIYSHELFDIYNVDTIIRVGSAGSYSKDLNVNDLFLVKTSNTENSYAYECDKLESFDVNSDENINNVILETASELGKDIKSGVVYSTGAFYSNREISDLTSSGAECVEMETFSLFYNAKRLGKHASAILTISDSFVTGDKLSSEEREKGFDDMILLALESAVKIIRD